VSGPGRFVTQAKLWLSQTFDIFTFRCNKSLSRQIKDNNMVLDAHFFCRWSFVIHFLSENIGFGFGFMFVLTQ
jgi:hypothetical protein